MYSLLFRRLVTIADSSSLQRRKQSFFVLLNDKYCAYIAGADVYITQTGLVAGVRFSSGKGWNYAVTLKNQGVAAAMWWAATTSSASGTI